MNYDDWWGLWWWPNIIRMLNLVLFHWFFKAWRQHNTFEHVFGSAAIDGKDDRHSGAGNTKHDRLELVGKDQCIPVMLWNIVRVAFHDGFLPFWPPLVFWNVAKGNPLSFGGFFRYKKDLQFCSTTLGWDENLPHLAPKKTESSFVRKLDDPVL